MRIKRFTAPDMRTALRMVRDEQGPDAVILSSRQVAEGGVEVVAATDYDEALVQQTLRTMTAPPASPVPAAETPHRTGRAVFHIDGAPATSPAAATVPAIGYGAKALRDSSQRRALDNARRSIAGVPQRLPGGADAVANSSEFERLMRLWIATPGVEARP